MIQAMSAGVDGIDFAPIPPGVRIHSNAGSFAGPVAEHAWGLVLGAAKGLHVRNAKVVPRRLRGGTLLVLGCGAIGSEVASLSRSLDMEVTGISRSFARPELFAKRLQLSSLKEALQIADGVVITLPLTATTRGLITYELLKTTKDSVVVVNVGRGEVVSEPGLVRWLSERPESRYATDVFWKRGGRESFETGAWALPNFSGTRHVSGVPLGETLEVPMVAAAQNVRRYLETGSADHLVDRSEYFTPKSE
ncbi:MAG: 3-phosphoglycerate dehydrogenase [archaeon]|nr:MAG: 3-phosphoglycerate dehydrogenase [archaeon]